MMNSYIDPKLIEYSNSDSEFQSRSMSDPDLSDVEFENNRLGKVFTVTSKISPTHIVSNFRHQKFKGRRKTTLYPRSHYQTNSRSRRKWNMIFFILKIPLIVFSLWLLKATFLYITASFANILVPNQ